MTPEEQAHAVALEGLEPPVELRRRLSWLRVAGVVVLAGAVGAAIVGFSAGTKRATAALPVSSFAPYVDVTATPQFGFEDPTQSVATNVVLGFVVGAPAAPCQPSWGAAYSLSSASTGMDLDRRIARLRQRGGQVTVSFGGQANSELSTGCTDVAELTSAYKSVVDRYSLTAIDLDIEGDAASTPEVDARRAQAISALQTQEKAAGHDVAVWLTLPVSPTGLTEAGTGVLSSMIDAHVTLAGVNALTMDYGQPLNAGQTMTDLAESALIALERQVNSAYSKAGIALSDDATWQHLGATAMIGQNDTASERFELTDAKQLLTFAQQHHLRQLSMWSINRDQTCGPNYANVEVVSPNCSGVNQSAGAFANIFKAFTTAAGSAPLAATAGATAQSSDRVATTTADDPATSPYAIWNSAQAYAKGTKIVWHHNVYEAKWYTQGDTPDAPVATPSDTPWTLIGPVLPGEHPAPTPTLSAGTYSDWSPSTIYVGGDRVLYDGVGYQAKWWTQGDVPGVAVISPSDTPWQVLTS
jgi:chitinase